jgi:hypothetical protein
VGAAGGLLPGREGSAGELAGGAVVARASERCPNGEPGAVVGGDDSCGHGDADAVFGSRADAVSGAGQGGRGPNQLASRVCDDLHVHPMRLVLTGVGRPGGP